MNKNISTKGLLRLGLGIGCLIALGVPQNLRSQEVPPTRQGPTSKIFVSDDYTFQILLKPGVDLTVQIRDLPKTGAENATSVSQNSTTTLQRSIRSNIICVIENVGEKGKESIFYYTGGWCAYDDPRRGLNVRRPNMEGLLFPMEFYHFPELLWAEPNTRQPDPIVSEGAPKIHLYKDGVRTLEVNAITGLPLRYNDGDQEWIYSYKENSTPIVVPDKLAVALRRVLSKQKS